ncbi:MAG: lipopolysaccharide heptosyltransferase II [Candidatus Omnitrophota bacterium]
MPESRKLKRILIINIFGIGDVLFTTPLISNLKEHFPDIFIGYVCNKRALSILQNNPKIDKLFVYERDEFHEIYKKSKVQFLKKMRQMLADIKNENFDCVMDLSLNFWTGFLMWLIGIRKRVGFNYKNRNPFLNRKIHLKGFEKQHVIEYYLSLLEPLKVPILRNKLEVFPQKEDKKWAEDLLTTYNIKKDDFLIAIIPGGGASWGKDAQYKQWSMSKFAELGDQCVKEFSAKIILMGSQEEERLCRFVADNMHHEAIQCAGKATIPQTLALLAKCCLAIVNDGGPLHMAVAMKVPTVSIFGPVDERVYGPYPKDNHVVVTHPIACHPCYRRFRMASCAHHNCLNRLSVEDVMKGVQEAYESTIR